MLDAGIPTPETSALILFVPVGGGPTEGMGPENHINLTKCVRNTEYSCSKSHVHKITNVLVFFIWRLDLMILMGANPFGEPLEGGEP
jgi:hypothetical protein